jgi:hypothetical protein
MRKLGANTSLGTSSCSRLLRCIFAPPISALRTRCRSIAALLMRAIVSTALLSAVHCNEFVQAKNPPIVQ